MLAEESHCGICGAEVDVDRPYRDVAGRVDPMSPAVDHVVALAEGGALLDRANVRLAHLSCNARRGAELMISRRRARSVPKLERMTKAGLIELVGQLRDQLDRFVEVRTIESEVRRALPPDPSELTGFDPARAELALTLARGLDQGAEMGTAATARELRAVLDDLEASLGSGDESESFWAGMSAAVGDAED